MDRQEFWSEVLNLKYQKDIVRGELKGIVFKNGIYYSSDEMKQLAGASNELKIETHKVKSMFSGCIEALDNILA